jgi:hypothetical protein
MLQIYSLRPDANFDINSIVGKLDICVEENAVDFEILSDVKNWFPEIRNETIFQIIGVFENFLRCGYFDNPQIHPQLMTSFANTVLKWGKEYNIEIIVFTHDMDLIESFVSSDLIPDNQNVFTRVSKDENMQYSKQEILDAIESNIDFR